MDKNYFVAIPEISGGLIFLLTIIYLRISTNIISAKVLLLLTQGTLLIVMLATGGTAGTGIFWYFTFPITAFFLMGKKSGMIWILSLYIATLSLFILGSLGLVSIAYSFIEIRQLLASLLIVSALIYLYQDSIRKSELKYKQRTEQLKIAKRSIEQAKAEDEAILASLGEGMITMGTSGNVFFLNNAALKMLKFEEQKIVGQSINEVIPLKDVKGNKISQENRPWFLARNAYNKEEVIIVVADTGYGIPKAQAGKIFTKLFRADNIKVGDTDGTGLGLYIVKSIVEAVGGKIWFESEENKGTRFYIFLPKEGMRAREGEKKLVPAKNNE